MALHFSEHRQLIRFYYQAKVPGHTADAMLSDSTSDRSKRRIPKGVAVTAELRKGETDDRCPE